MNLATGLMNRGEATVNYKMQWEKSHAGDYETDTAQKHEHKLVSDPVIQQHH